MQKNLIILNKIKTTVLKYNPKNTLSSEIILIIPGNPGITSFYEQFIECIYEKCNNIPVWIISHAGHETFDKKEISVKGHEHLFNLQGQILHKKEFVEKFVSEETKIHLIGHSIGSYIILNLLLDKWINDKIIKTYLLFPTFENMKETPHGKFFSKFVKPVTGLLLFLLWIFILLPRFLRNGLVYLYMKLEKTPVTHLKSYVSFLQPTVLEKVLYMAFDELTHVKSPPKSLFTNLDKIYLLYGDHDGWTPLKFFQKMNDLSGIQCELCAFDHAFVLRHSKQVAEIVSNWIIK